MRSLWKSLLVAAPSVFGSAAFAQCSMCRTAAAAQNMKAANAVNLGVVILLLPATMLFTGVFAWSLKRRDQDAGQNERDDRP